MTKSKRQYSISYADVLTKAKKISPRDIVGYLRHRLPELWAGQYRESTGRPTNLVDVQLGSLMYIYDWYSGLEDLGIVASSSRKIEDRLVAVCGHSSVPTRAREKSRIRGWAGPTEESLGENRDKGHFIAHSMGGMVDGLEINFFSQLRPLNRGWSREGMQFRQMEAYCAAHPGTFCFNRPLYEDDSSCPSAFEFGFLRPQLVFDVSQFKN